MTIEEKAKAYDEALERAREWSETKNGYYTPKELCEIIFPELAESEDERIKKAIKKALQVKCDGSRIISDEPVTLEEAIAWLEKQGEQKSAWSEEDEKYSSYICAALQCYYRLREDRNNTNGQEDLDKARNWLYNRLKSLRPQKQEQWNEQDIEMIDWLIRCCEKEYEELCNDRYGHQEIVSDLKRDCKKKWDWLESLKSKVVPQNIWKPSEEQMEALDFAADCIVPAEFCFKRKELKGLLEQLKKLKG